MKSLVTKFTFIKILENENFNQQIKDFKTHINSNINFDEYFYYKYKNFKNFK